MTTELRAALMSPPGVAAVATVAVAGPDAWSAIRGLFRGTSGKGLPETPDVARHWTGQFGAPPGDTVVISIVRGDPRPWVEIHSHGGRRVVEWLLDELVRAGCEICSAKRLMDGFESSPIRSAAAVALTQATTRRTAGILLDQFRGALDDAIREVWVALGRQEVANAKRRLAELLQFSDIGRRLTGAWRVAVCGAPNVGKSSLINRLAGYPRCVVAPLPGTTRDAVAVPVAIDGWPVELIDTAGQRSTPDELERAGIERAYQSMASADLVLWLIDATGQRPEWPAPSWPALVVANKMDLASTWPAAVHAAISASTGQGIDDLLETMSRRLAPNVPSPGAAVPFAGELADRLGEIANQLADGEVTPAVAALRTLLGPTAS